MRAKKSYGQHFLKDMSLSQDIATAILDNDQYEILLEVGPGQGALTQFLKVSQRPLHVVEADGDMVNHLIKHEIMDEANIIHKNFLRLKIEDYFGEKKIGLCGNYPYNISSQIIFKMLDYKDQIPVMVGMFQKEMAMRILSPPGSKNYSVISVFTQVYYNTKLLFEVPPWAFNPPPKVNSAVIMLERNERTSFPCNYSTFRSVVKMSFGQRRKMLRNTLKSLVMDHSLFDDPFFERRPEHVSVEEYIELAKRIEDSNKNYELRNDELGIGN